MNFRLERQKESTRALSVFRVLDSANATIGTITVPRAQESDLLQHWKGRTAPAAKQSQAAAAAALSAALRKGPRLSREGVLRGC